ncbi:MAG: secretin N-terminal domain-containing protein [Betaproteobacteria bacterium]
MVLALALAACATKEGLREAQSLMDVGQIEEALVRLEAEHRAHPRDVEIRNYYLRNRAAAVQRFIAAGDQARAVGAFDRAAEAYRRALRFDPESAQALAGLDLVEKERRVLGVLAEALAAQQRGDDAEAYAKARQVLAAFPQQREARAIVRSLEEKAAKAESAQPQLGEALKKPITMEFRDAPLRTVFELISRHTGLNFVFDKDVPADARATVFVRNSSIDEVIRLVLVTNQLERRVLNDNTLLIYPNNPQKNQAYKELTVKSFYLANADVKQTAALVRQLVKTRDMYVDEKLNLLVIRDTPEAVRMAEKLIASQDLGEPEVLLEVEVLEVGTSVLENLGIQWPASLGVSIQGAAGTAGVITGREAQNFDSTLVRLTLPSVALNFNRQDGRTNVLANPRIRVKNREKARIHIGDKVPVTTTTAGATGFVSESISYLDVGLKLEVEPVVYLESDVGIKVNLEVSNIARQITNPSGTVAYQIGTRNAATTLRLRDGETQMLAGLISDEDRRNTNRVPGLSDMPTLGRLFSSQLDNLNRTEIVLLITPRVVRNIERPGARIEEFNSGTELDVGGMGLAGAPVPPSITAPAPAAPPASPSPPPGSVPPPLTQPNQPSGIGFPPPAAGVPERRQ